MDEAEAKARLRLIAIQKERASAVEEAEEEIDPYLYEDGVVAGPNPAAFPTKEETRGYLPNLVRAGLRGATSGGIDEFGGAGRAILPDSPYDFGGDVSQEGQDFGERRKMYTDDARLSQARFAAENPKAAFAAELAGGFASPLNKVAPGFGVGTKATDIGSAIARGTVEGGLAGLLEGEGSFEERLDSAAGGAKMGAGATTGLAGLGGLSNAVTYANKGIKEMRGADGSFLPLSLADEDGILGRLTRNFTGRSTVGGNRIRGQERPFVDDASSSLEKARLDIADRTQELAEDIDIQKRSIGQERDYNIAQEKVSPELQAVPDIPARSRAAQAADPAPIPAAEVIEDTVTPEFLAGRAEAAVPAHMTEDVLGDTDPTDIFEVNQKIGGFWGGPKAFTEVKGKNDWKLDDDLKEQLLELSNDPSMRETMDDVLQSVTRKGTKIGNIDIKGLSPEKALEKLMDADLPGDVMMELRNSFARQANKGGGYAAQQVKNALDDNIRRGLSDTEVTQFDDQIARYTDALSYQDMVRGKSGLTGEASIEEFYSPAGSYDSRGAAAADRPGLAQSREAYAARSVIDDTNSQAVAAQQLAEAERKATIAQNKAARTTNADDILRAREAADNVKIANRRAEQAARDANKATESLAGDVASQQRLTLATAARGKRNALAEEKVTGAYGQAADEARRIASLTTPENASGLSEQLTNRMAGSFVPDEAGWAAGTAGSLASLLGASSQAGQTFLAGQLPWQRAIAKALRDGDTAKVRQMISRESARQSQEKDNAPR